MDHKEFAKYHIWCDKRGIRVYPEPSSQGVFNLVVERDGRPSKGTHFFYDKPTTPEQVCVWDQIGILLKAIVYKELNLMEIKSTYNQLEGICEAAFKKDKEGIVRWLSDGVPFREAVLYLEAFYPDKKESGALITKLAHCKCGQLINFGTKRKEKTLCPNCSLQKGLSK